MTKLERIKGLAATLEVAAVVIAVAGLVFRSTFYWTLGPGPGEAYGRGDVLEFLFALVLFLVCALCAAAGVAISFMGTIEDRRLAYRAVLIGILSFIGYEFLHDQMPRLL